MEVTPIEQIFLAMNNKVRRMAFSHPESVFLVII